MAESDTGDVDVQRAPEERFHRNAADRIREHSFPLAVRGYDRQAVDDFVEQVADLVADLEGRQTRESVVQRALDQVGEETAGILQRAHETADEIAARSRAKADGRLQRAEREAEIVRREADEYARHVVEDTRLLWEDRQRLIEDIRQLADEVLATADDAMERVKMPEPLAADDIDSEAEREAPSFGPVAVPAPEPDGPDSLDPGEEYEAEGPYDRGELDEGSPEDETAPYRIGADDEERPPEARERFPSDDVSGHTVELEALPGGGDEPADPDERPPRDH
jgi:cell division initiation protein